jgi:hypothetical protein
MSTSAFPKYQLDDQDQTLHYFQQDRVIGHLSNNWAMEEFKSFLGDTTIWKDFYSLSLHVLTQLLPVESAEWQGV